MCVKSIIKEQKGSNELEYIKLKVDWYKSSTPWLLAVVAANLTLLEITDELNFFNLTFTILSISSLLIAVVLFWEASRVLINSLITTTKTGNGAARKRGTWGSFFSGAGLFLFTAAITVPYW